MVVFLTPIKKMNRLIPLFILSILVYPSLAMADWVHCFTDAAGNNTYYDAKSIVSVGKGATKVSVRTDYSTKGKNDFIKIRISRGLDVKGYENLSHSVTVWYINCARIENDLYSIFEYDRDDGIISTYKAKEIIMEPVQPGTIGDIFYKIVCK